MLMTGEGNRSNPTIHITPWSYFDNSMAKMIFPLPVSGISASIERKFEYSYTLLAEFLAALHRYVPSNDKTDTNSDISGHDFHVPVVTYSCDEFRMYDFKVRLCTRESPHEWVECPFAHPGEKARRRDPLKFGYSATTCTDFRRGHCKKGDSCGNAHGVFENLLHPDRYRTQPCKDGTDCRRRVCFFAHTAEQLRVVTQEGLLTRPILMKTESPRSSYNGSPIRHGIDSYFMNGSSPNSTFMSSSPPTLNRSGIGCSSEDDRARNMKVESGREVRVKLFRKLTEQNSVERVESFASVPDVGWISELVM